MSSGSVARRYAKAIVDIGDAQQILTVLGSDIEKIAQLFASSAELAVSMSNPAFPRSDRRKILAAVLERVQTHAITRNVMNLLLDKDRIGELAAIARELRALIQARSGKLTAEIISFAPLAADQLAAITASLEKLTGKRLDVTKREDASLLGGVVAKVGDVVYDGSLKTQLRTLRDQLA